MQDLTLNVQQSVSIALAEDVGTGDISATLIVNNTHAEARIICREPAILCGCAWVDEVFKQLHADIVVHWNLKDGDRIPANSIVCSLTGNSRALLSGERVALNFLQTLSATATVVRQYVDKIQHTGVRILDTRKTIPGLRLAQKYAVRSGGGQNHRMGLYDAILLKENHLASIGSIASAVAYCRAQFPDKFIEIEVETLDQLQQAIDNRVNRVLLDNFSLADIKQAVIINAQRIELEVSGGVNDSNLVALAETGIDYLSIGALTKNVRAIDFSMRFI